MPISVVKEVSLLMTLRSETLSPLPPALGQNKDFSSKIRFPLKILSERSSHHQQIAVFVYYQRICR